MTDHPFAPQTGVPLTLAPGLRLVLAPNSSPMTERGTNTWILGDGAVSVIDPGPADPAHLRAILAALRPGERVAQILVTHAHKDHSPLARPLREATGAPVLAFGDARAGMSARMAALDPGDLGGGEGVHDGFVPDENLPDGTTFEAGGRPCTALHTPGHLGNHLCFHWGAWLFTGDHLMGWAPSLVSPPEGDLTDFMTSLQRVEGLGPLHALPGHGAPVPDSAARARALYAHRKGREAAIVDAIQGGADTLGAIVAQVYHDVARDLWPAAARNVLAHVLDLQARTQVQITGRPGPAMRIEMA